jgi:PAS domain S-box-containing protein
MVPEASLSEGWRAAVHPDDLSRLLAVRDRAVVEGEVFEAEVRLRHREGAYRWHLVRSVPVHDEASRLARRFGAATDIDDRRRAEEALRASEQQYRAVYDQAAVGIAEVDLTGRFLRANDRYGEIVGYTREELLGLRFRDITHPDDPPAHLEQFARLAEGPPSYTIEKRYVREDGRVVWARTAVSLIRDGAGRPERVVAVVEDITERVQSGAALRQSETRFRAISEAAPLGIFLADAAGDCLYTNRAYFELTGRRAGEVLGEGWREVIHPEDRDRVFAAWYQAARDRSPFDLVYRYMHRDGRTIWVSCKSAEIRVGDALMGYVGVVEDITQKRQSIEALRRSEERFDLAVRGTDAGIWDWDLRTDTLYFSARWKSMLGYAEDEVRNEFSEWESRVHPDDRDRANKAVQDYLEGRSAEYELEHRLRHKDGSYRWILSRGAAVRDRDGRPCRMVGSHIDITVHKQTANRLNENLAQLKAAQTIQQAMLPQRPPALTGLDIAGASYPAAYASGDMFNYLPMLGGNLGIVIADVAGHGIGAALQMASTQAFLRSLAQTCVTVGEIMTRVNRFVFEENGGESFVTMMLIRLDPRTRSLTYANAGHPPGYVLDPSGNVRAELGSSAIPLGIEEQCDFPVAEPVALRPGELVMLVTDGILEAESPEGTFFGSERLLEVIRTTRDRTGQEILEGLHRAVGRHTGTEVFKDDVTAVVIKIGR